jgi:hypothetical protein
MHNKEENEQQLGLHYNEWRHALYREGSEACRNYSRLTMQTRTLSQQILVVGVVGLSAAVASKEAFRRPEIVLTGGLALVAFAVSLAFVDWHYQSAFTAIRNSLAEIEHELELMGPWRAHLAERTHVKDHVASYVPFILLCIIGCIGTLIGIELGGASEFLTKVWFWLMIGIVLIGASIFLGYLCVKAATRDKAMYKRLKDSSEQAA